MWIWKSSEGELWKDGVRVAEGYSGAPGFINDVTKEHLKCQGPIPRGTWRLGNTLSSHTKVGPVAIRLSPVGHDAKGRSDFLIHGDSLKRPGTASEGCIILPRAARLLISQSSDRELVVV